ncbi:putative glycosyl transferase group 1 [Sphingopyxis fribergensis]|uniref:Putative glycosyl transferase group 1 n=1 Tax=Sphingopyxis fribergensis TaxID=1515612 RepID=A0A0A7PMP3_9SPHN|nr:glycosyltransferase family 1 protein [Sphingopyxis fribergensis]AJA11290.1 putative glycosyl transferase group 1 [Sphingopyxis fribergensis]
MPSKPRKVVINGKFLSGVPTGVHRVAEELIRHAKTIVDQDPEIGRRIELSLWVPRNGEAKAKHMDMPYRVVGPFSGNLWEQITLPLRARGRTIVSLCNVGPMLTRDAITMFHDAQVHLAPDSYSRPFRLWYRLHQPISGRRHRRILTVSHFSREQLERVGVAGLDKTAVVHNGVDHVLSTVPDDAALQRLGLGDEPFVVALANTQPHKNIGLLLKAFSRSELEGTKLVLFGSARAGDFVAAGHVVPANVVFAGRVSDAELRSLYGHALCIAFPSLTEGFGLPPLEAMTTGCPAIVAPLGALPEICADAVVYAAADDPGAWAAAIVRLNQDGDFRTEMRAAGERQAASFTWKRAASRLVEELLAL